MLEHIKDSKCPECGAEIKSERREHKHTNGSWNEHRTFECGLELHFVPNFMSVQKNNPCREDKEILKQKKVDLTFIDKIKKTINKDDKISPKLKNGLLSDIDSIQKRVS